MQNHSTPGRCAYWLRGPGPTGGVFPTPQPSLPRGAPPRVASVGPPEHPIAPSCRGASFFPGARRRMLVGPPEQEEASWGHPWGGQGEAWGQVKQLCAQSLCENKAVFMRVGFPLHGSRGRLCPTFSA